MSFFETFIANIAAGVTIAVTVIILYMIIKKVKFLSKFLMGKKIPSVSLGSNSVCSPTTMSLSGKKDKKDDNAKEDYEKLIKEFEDDNEKFIFINHSLNTSAMSFMDNGQCLGLKDSTKILDIIQESKDNVNLNIVITTTGGSLTAAEIITDALLNYPGVKKIYIPHYAFSAGTLISLSGNEIYLGKGASLGQVDPQGMLGPSQAIISYVDKYIKGDDETKINSFFSAIICFVHEEAIKSIDRVKKITKKACEKNGYADENYKKIEELLIDGQSNHDTPLFYNDVKEHISQINDGIPENVEKLINLHTKVNKKSGGGGLFGGLL